MAFPKKLLTTDEELVLDARPHWIALVGPAFATLVVVVAWIYFLALDHLPGKATKTKDASSFHTILFWAILIAGLVVLLWYVLRTVVRWATSHFVVTNERIIHRQGLVAKNSMEIPLDRIQNVRFHQGVFERMIGAGDLVIESAGERGDNVFADIRRPESVQKIIYERAEVHTMKMQGGGKAEAPPPSMTEELQRLADLRDRGAITEDEFQAQKARLLGGS